MNGIDLFFQLPIIAQAAIVCFVACASCLFVMILAAPRKNCFFFRWRSGNEIPGSAGFAGAAYYLARCCLCFVP